MDLNLPPKKVPNYAHTVSPLVLFVAVCAGYHYTIMMFLHSVPMVQGQLEGKMILGIPFDFLYYVLCGAGIFLAYAVMTRIYVSFSFMMAGHVYANSKDLKFYLYAVLSAKCAVQALVSLLYYNLPHVFVFASTAINAVLTVSAAVGLYFIITKRYQCTGKKSLIFKGCVYPALVYISAIALSGLFL